MLLQELKDYPGVTKLRIESLNEKDIGKIHFLFCGVPFSALYSIDVKGLYAVEILDLKLFFETVSNLLKNDKHS